MNIVLNVTETERWSVLTQCIEGELCLAEEIESEKGNGTYVIKDTCPLPLVEKLIVKDDVQKLIVFYQQAEFYISENLRSGLDVSEAANKWDVLVSKIIAIQKKNRKKIELYDIEQVLKDLDGFEVSSGFQVISPAIDCFLNGFYQDFFLMVASKYIDQSDYLKKSKLLIQASSVLVDPDNKILLDIDEIIKEEIKVKKELKEEYKIIIDKLIQDNSFLIENNRKLKDEISFSDKEKLLLKNELLCKQDLLESYYEEANLSKILTEKIKKMEVEADEINDIVELYKDKDKSQIKDIDCYKNEIKSLTSVNESLLLDLKEKEKEKEIFSIQIYRMQEELDCRYIVDGSELDQEKTSKHLFSYEEYGELEAKRYRVKKLESYIFDIEKSFGWKVASMCRFFIGLFWSSKKKSWFETDKVELILSSGYFDIDWYKKEYPDVTASSMNPALHYLKFGASENRSPSLRFDGPKYLEDNPDVRESGVNPLLHYIEFGKKEGRVAPQKSVISDRSEENG